MTRGRALLGYASALVLSLGLAGCTEPSAPHDELTVMFDPSGTGTGTVTGLGGLNCPGVCTETSPSLGTPIYYLTATPDPTSDFITWGGACASAGSNPSTTLVMDGNPTCTARFDLKAVTHQLYLNQDPTSTGTGTVTGQGIACGTNCTEIYAENENVLLFAAPDPGSHFVEWGGDCAIFGSNPNPTLTMDSDKICTFLFDDDNTPGGILVPRGSIAFGYRVEAGLVSATSAWTVGYDSAKGHVHDITDLDNLSAPGNPEFSVCAGARGLTSFFANFAPYNADILYTTCTSSRSGATTLTTGGFTQLIPYAFAPGEARFWPGTNLAAVVDFEFGKLHLLEQAQIPGPEQVIDLTTPLERSCPFSLTINNSIAYVVGREGAAGTSTANCDNWRGMWRVDLSSKTVLGFTPFGTQPRIPYYFNGSIYVSDFAEDKIYVLNATTGAVDHTFDAGDGPVGMVIEDRPAASDRMYVTNWADNSVSIIDLTTEQVLDNQPSGGVNPVQIFLNGSTLMVLNFGDAATSTGAVLKAFTIQ